MGLNVLLAFLIGFIVGVLVHWISLEIGYKRWERDRAEQRFERNIRNWESVISDLERLNRQIDFRVGAENEDK